LWGVDRACRLRGVFGGTWCSGRSPRGCERIAKALWSRYQTTHLVACDLGGEGAPARRLQEEVESSVFFYEPTMKNGEQKGKNNRQDQD
jgi:hypothetical protein